LDSPRFHEIDVLKCVSILAVVYIHSISTSFSPTNFLGLFFADITRFAVPGLFFAAGFLFDINKVSTGQIIKKKLIRILPPYVFCSLCIQFLNLPGLSVSLENLDAKQLIFNLVFGNTLGIYYFIFVLLYLYAFSLILRHIPDKWVLVIWGISIFLTLFFVKKVVLQGYSLFVLFRHPFFHCLSYLTGWIFFLYYQKITSIVKQHLTVIFLTFIILDIALLTFSRMNGGSFNLFPILTQFHIYICITLLLILGIKTTKYQKIIQFFSDYSYGIYLLHFPIVRSCQLFYPEIAADFSFSYAFVSWSAGVSISVFIIFAIKKIAGRYSIYLVGC
jgi:surface polysaccharide O-acyltransferase-like enzyme